MLMRLCAAAYLGFFACVPAWSGDVEIIPQVGAGFAVKNAANDSNRFKVNESGEVMIPSLPENMAGKPLCWDKATGILRQCPEAAGTDFVPPTIEVDAPALATQSSVEVTTRVEDNVELSQLVKYLQFSLFGDIGRRLFPNTLFSGSTKKSELRESVEIRLNSGPTTGTYIITDTSGNVAKAEWVTLAPETAIVPGSYDVVGSVTVPNGFDCSDDLNSSSEEGASIRRLGIYDGYCQWSVAEGYCPSAGIEFDDTRGWGFPGSDDRKVSLEANNFTAGYNYDFGDAQYRYHGSFEAINSEPPTIQATVIKQCNINGAGWINGIPVSFTAQWVDNKGL